MTQIAMVDVQPKNTMQEAHKNLIQYAEVDSESIGLERLYELINCKVVEKVWLADLDKYRELLLVVDENGTFGQWNRGIKIQDQNGYEHTILGNCVFAVFDKHSGYWKGWDNETQMADEIRSYTSTIKFGEVIYYQLSMTTEWKEFKLAKENTTT